MPNVRKPSLRRDHKGQNIVKWGGRVHYLGVDKARAQVKYAQEIVKWAQWRAERTRVPARPRTLITVFELYERYLAAKKGQRAEQTILHIKNSLRRFLITFSTMPAESIRPVVLQDFKQSLGKLALAPRTINHEIAAAKAMLRYGWRMELIPVVDLGIVEPIPLPRPKPKGYTPAQVKAMIYKAPPYLACWIELHWNLMARNMEMIRVVGDAGEWPEPWLFRPDQAKTGGRHLVFSNHSLTLLDVCEPRYTRMDSYGTACGRACGCYPHAIRHGAAQYLHSQGVGRAEIDQALGHLPSRVSVTYNPVEYEPLRATMSLLAPALAG